MMLIDTVANPAFIILGVDCLSAEKQRSGRQILACAVVIGWFLSLIMNIMIDLVFDWLKQAGIFNDFLHG